MTDTIAVGDGPNGLAVAPDGSRVYVSNFDSDTLTVIDTGTATPTATIPVGDGPTGVAASSPADV
ncbi:YncE family protein [Streptomyces yangpuensis]|uniref:YncE family protein n=1 Tax=Streptomyces yangpuensis TaxID=1648182 RepID=UPI0036885C2A